MEIIKKLNRLAIYSFLFSLSLVGVVFFLGGAGSYWVLLLLVAIFMIFVGCPLLFIVLGVISLVRVIKTKEGRVVFALLSIMTGFMIGLAGIIFGPLILVYFFL